MTPVVELTDLNADMQDLLWTLVEQDPTQNFWEAHREYTLLKNNSTVMLSDHLLRRKRKQKDNMPPSEEERLEVLDQNLLGKGALSSVHISRATLIPDSKTRTFRKSRDTVYTREDARRVAKLGDPSVFIQNPNLGRQVEPADNILEVMQNESEMLAASGSIKSKPLVTIPKLGAAIVMERLKGKELFDVLNEDLVQVRLLSIEERYELSIAVVEAYISTCFEKDVVHKDLKQEAFMVDDSVKPMRVRLFDFGFSRKSNDPRVNESCGTPGFAANEQQQGVNVSSASDMYAIGAVLSYIWDNEDDAPTTLHDERIQGQYSKLYTDDRLLVFKNSRFAEPLREWLKRTLPNNPKDRIGPHELLNGLRHEYAEYVKDIPVAYRPLFFKRSMSQMNVVNPRVRVPRKEAPSMPVLSKSSSL